MACEPVIHSARISRARGPERLAVTGLPGGPSFSTAPLEKALRRSLTVRRLKTAKKIVKESF